MSDLGRLLVDESLRAAVRMDVERLLDRHILDGEIIEHGYYGLSGSMGETVNRALDQMEKLDFDYSCVVGWNSPRDIDTLHVLEQRGAEIVDNTVDDDGYVTNVVYRLDGETRYMHIFWGFASDDAWEASVVSTSPMTRKQAENAFLGLLDG